MSPPRIGKRSDEVARLRELLRSREARDAAGRIVLEGKTLIADAIARGVQVERVYISADATRAFESELERYADAGIEVVELAIGAVDRIATTRTPQPLLAEVISPFRESPTLSDRGLLIGLIGVSDPGNLGTIIRVAEAAGAAGIVHMSGCDSSAPKVVRASAGSCFAVPIYEADRYSPDLLATGSRRVFGAAGHRGQSVADCNWASATSVLFGSESHGIPAEVAEQLEEWVHIPMAGKVESLNVAMSVAVVAFTAGMSRSA